MVQTLKLSKETVEVLKNFNAINPSLMFKKGSVISTRHPMSKYIQARYNCPETFKSDFGIHKLDKFLSILSFFEEPVVKVDSNYLLVTSDKDTAKFIFADPRVIVSPTKDKLELPSVDAQFQLKKAHINTIIKALSVMELPRITFDSDGETISLKAFDPKQPNGSSYSIEVCPTNSKNVWQAIFNPSNLKMLPMDYDVKISARGIAEFSNEKLTYWIAVEKDSRFAT